MNVSTGTQYVQKEMTYQICLFSSSIENGLDEEETENINLKCQ